MQIVKSEKKLVLRTHKQTFSGIADILYAQYQHNLIQNQ